MLQMRFRVVKNLPKLAQLKRDRARTLAIWIQHAVFKQHKTLLFFKCREVATDTQPLHLGGIMEWQGLS